MNISLYNEAIKVVPGKYILCNVLSKRIRQLQKGAEPLLPIAECEGMENIDIALKEIAEGKISLVSRPTIL